MAVGFFFAPRQFGVNQRRILHLGGCRRHFFGGCVCAVFAFDKSTFFADFNLNRAGFAGGIGLLDFAG